MAPVSIKALHTEVPILVGKVVPCSDPITTSSVRFAFGPRLSNTSSVISVSSGLLSSLSVQLVGRICLIVWIVIGHHQLNNFHYLLASYRFPG